MDNFAMENDYRYFIARGDALRIVTDFVESRRVVTEQLQDCLAKMGGGYVQFKADALESISIDKVVAHDPEQSLNWSPDLVHMLAMIRLPTLENLTLSLGLPLPKGHQKAIIGRKKHVLPGCEVVGAFMVIRLPNIAPYNDPAVFPAGCFEMHQHSYELLKQNHDPKSLHPLARRSTMRRLREQGRQYPDII